MYVIILRLHDCALLSLYEHIGFQVLLESETLRANECEKKYAEAMESINIMRQKLEETERRVLILQYYTTMPNAYTVE